MSTWTEPFFIQSLIICLLGLSISYWWLSNKIKSKLREVEERQSKSRESKKWKIYSLTAAVHLSFCGTSTISIWHANISLWLPISFLRFTKPSKQHGQCGWGGLIHKSIFPAALISTPLNIDSSVIGFPWYSVAFLKIFARRFCAVIFALVIVSPLSYLWEFISHC